MLEGNIGFSFLRVALLSRRKLPSYFDVEVFKAWLRRAEKGEKAALAEAPHYVKWAKRLERIVRGMSFLKWDQEFRESTNIQDVGIAFGDKLKRWLVNCPGAKDELRLAVRQSLSWAPKAQLVGYYPLPNRPVADSSSRKIAAVLYKRAIEPIMNGYFPSNGARVGLMAAVEPMLGVTACNIWILPFLDEIDAARIARRNAAIRDVTLSVSAQERYSAQEVPPLRQHAELVLLKTRQAISQWSEFVELPPWLGIELVAVIIERYAHEGGGGRGRKLSRAAWTQLLNDPRLLVRDLEKSRSNAKSAREKKLIKGVIDRIEAHPKPT